MLKSGLVESAVSLLCESGFRTVDCRGSRSSFDIVAKREGDVLLVKALANVEGLSRESAEELKAVASLLEAAPVVLSERMKSSDLADGTVYDRYGVYVVNARTLAEIVNDRAPKAFSTRGNYCVHVDTGLLAEARRRHGLTQESLAEKIGVSKQSVYRYESHGRVSVDVFDRLTRLFGDEFVQSHFKLQSGRSGQVSMPKSQMTSFKRLVCKEFEQMGFDTSLTHAPFDVVASREEKVFSVVSNDWRRLEGKLSVLDEVSEVLGGYRLCISERKVKTEVSVMSPQELSEIKTTRELFKLLSDK
jgi:putative transcriptional regulator